MNKLKWLVLPALSLTLAAQTAPARRSSAASKQSQAPAVTSDDIRALRDALAEQQRQIQQLRQELQRRDQAMDQQEQKLNQLQSATSAAQSQASAAEQGTEGVSKIQSDVNDIKLNQTNAAVSTQDDQKRILAEGKARPHRWAPEKGYVTLIARDEKDLEAAMEVIRMSRDHFSSNTNETLK